MLRIGLILILLSITHISHGFHASLGGFQHRNAVQDSSGSKTAASLSPNLAIGHNFFLFDGWEMSPQLGYIHHILGSDDSYGKYTSYSVFILFDFFYNPSWSQRLKFRYGIGNFMRSIKGEGGAVTVPNGSGFDTAYRPGSTSTSYSTSLDLGMDYYFFEPSFGGASSLFSSDTGYQDGFGGGVNWGLRFSLFLFEILDSDKATWSYQIALTGYF